MRARNGQTVFQARHFAEHFCTANNRDLPVERGTRLWVGVRAYSAGIHHHFSVAQMVGAMPHADARTKLCKVIGNIRAVQIRPTHAETLRKQDLGDTAHAYAANTDEVNVSYRRKNHGRSYGSVAEYLCQNVLPVHNVVVARWTVKDEMDK